MWGKLYGSFIILGRYKYSYVISKRADLKSDIDEYLTSTGNESLIVS